MQKAKILVVDDTALNVKLLADILTVHDYDVATAASGPEALVRIKDWNPDLVLLDVVMPGMSGYDVCTKIRQNPDSGVLPVVMVTALDPDKELINGLEAGADDFLTKPVNQPELLARVRSLLRVKRLYDQVQAQGTELAALNRELETRVQEQVDQIERLGRLRRFLSPQVADLIVERGEDALLRSHRRQIATLFCDLRGFTAFSEAGEPEDVMDVLQTYHESLGRLIHEFQGTIDHRAGDGIMVVFNDPLPCDDPAIRAISLARSMRAQMRTLARDWKRLGHELGFGVGISLGYATLGMVGYEGRFDYTANGSAVNLAARLCDEAEDGQILLSERARAAVDGAVQAEPVGPFELKGFRRPVAAYNVVNAPEED